MLCAFTRGTLLILLYHFLCYCYKIKAEYTTPNLEACLLVSDNGPVLKLFQSTHLIMKSKAKYLLVLRRTGLKKNK